MNKAPWDKYFTRIQDSSYVIISAFPKQSYHKGSGHGFINNDLTTCFKGK